ncbi:MAG: hypothetical protein ACI4QE_00405 [Acutalibacteraceae bacterium]
MIKGINRQVIEVQETDNIYYEKAFLILRPEFSSAQRHLLEREAKILVKNMGSPASMKMSRRFLYWAVRLGASALIGGIVALWIYICVF